ncbi:hypothetical protein PV08_11851 [Exophiala spinifera]|uniref:Protein kinase domain-containing protein n=1 Tax=Exophiala spinifera TaxID=91928 RepID=A0A0D1Y468_9EURO|nr:uncharacterized protein PV08_11851 [Exophiala spinifera]KIW09751.1 hypothetical protein PV08_11851 [Exophiala spinifera]
MPVPMQPGSHRNLSRSAQNRESRIDLGMLGNEPGSNSKSSTSANHLQQVARTAERISASWKRLSPINETGRSVDKGVGKQSEKVTVPDMRKSSEFPARQPPSGKGEPITIRHGSPWKTYDDGYELMFQDYVTVGTRLPPHSGKVAIKTYNKREGQRTLEMLNTVRHAKFIALIDVFEWDKKYFAVFEHVFISLEQVVGCTAYPTERQLVAILAQVLEGLCYLSSIGLQHGSLVCSNVLLKPSGDVVLANQEHCCAEEEPNTADVRAVGYIATKLMQKYVNEDGSIGIENSNRWPANSPSVSFLSMTTSAASVSELQQVRRPSNHHDSSRR